MGFNSVFKGLILNIRSTWQVVMTVMAQQTQA